MGLTSGMAALGFRAGSGAQPRRFASFLASGQNAEFVSLRIGQYDPGCAALTDVDAAGPEANESLDLRLLVIGHPVKMQPVLAPLRLGNLDEQDAGSLTGGRSQLYCVALLTHDLPPRDGLPPSRERRTITTVDNNFLKTKSHVSSLGRRRDSDQGSRSAARPGCGRR